VTLDLTRIGSLTAPPAAAPARDDGAAAAAHAERITLSEDARQSSRQLGPVPRGNVRWYRAAHLPRTPRPAPSADRAPVHAMHAGVATYRRAMARAAA